jgi:hypothetical protein
MSALSIQPTYPIFTDIDGQPLEAGYVWIGQANLDPQVNPINVYWDAALTISAPQPIRTLGGYPSRNGTPARLYVNSDYSIRVMNKNGSVVYSAPSATERYSEVVIGGVNASVVIYDPAGVGAAATTVQAKLRETVSVEDFGAIGVLNGGLDDTAAIQAAIDYAASIGKGIVLGGAYRVNFLTVKAGLSFFVSGTLIKTGSVSSTGLIVVNSDVRYCEVSDIDMDLGGIINRGIFCDGAANCTFDNNRVYNFPAYNPATPAEAIRLAQNSRYNHVSNNYLIMPDVSALPAATAIGIYVTSNALIYGNFENGSFVQPTNLAEKNKIYGNIILNGSHGISLFGGTANEIYDNYIDGPRDRGIHLTPVASQNFIHGNKIYNFGSSAIITAFGSNSNTITGNLCYAPNATGEGGIVCYVGASGSVISGNTIFTGANYGIYLAVEVNSCVITENQILAALNKEAAIAIENDWASPLPAGALFSRPNYAPPPAPRTNWASASTFDNTVSGNVITLPTVPANNIAAIYISQLGPTYQTTRNQVVNNTVTGAPQYNAYYYEQTASKMTNEVLKNLATSDLNPAKVYFSSGRDIFLICSGSPAVNESVVTFADGATTPDVSVGGLFQHNNSAPTSVTNYLGSLDGQEIQVRLSPNTTLVNNVLIIRLKGGVNAVGTSTDQFLTLRNSGGVWIETSRNF